ncbi:C2 family cysteine protease [Lignipirellula cremea]|nr:C2 family cysteine protease [Lignipirellula cremea]
MQKPARAIRPYEKRSPLGVEPLEARELFTVSSAGINNDKTLVIRADSFSTSAEIRQVGSNLVLKEGSKSWSFAASKVNTLHFSGGASNDKVINYTSKNFTAYGYGGNDYFSSRGSGADYFVGGDGNDSLYGNDGNDKLYGGAGNDLLSGGAGNDLVSGNDGNDEVYGGLGNDILYGGLGNDMLSGNEGNDKLYGDAGNDTMYGGDGDDYLWGQDGDDLLLGGNGNDQLMGGYGNDQLNGGAGADKMWGEYGNDVLIAIDNGTTDYVEGGSGADTLWVDKGSSRDSVYGLTSSDQLQEVKSFANGADKTLNGDRITDPKVAAAGEKYRTFSDNPLFSTSGPQTTDVRQGSLGDCYLLAGLGAIAKDSPQAIRSSVVDFNDGTYGVRLGDKFYRVDNDLVVKTSTSTTPAYAKLGAQNSMWVAVVEKAYAHYRTGANSFASIEGGWSVELNRAFGSTTAGAKSIQSYTSATALANDIANRVKAGQAVTIGFTGEKKVGKGPAPIITGHQYTVMSVKVVNGAVASITLRNPWGTDGGGSKDSNPNDGLITVTPAQLLAYVGNVNWGKV